MTFRGIQALRGFAAAAVVVFHATLSWWRIAAGRVSDRPPEFWTTGAAGVDVFFVISGFVMAISTFGKEDQPQIARRFLERRAIRLLPMYWIMTAVFALELLWLRGHPLWATHGEVYARLTTKFFLGSLSLVPFYHDGYTEPLVAVGWTLSYEVFFYLLFALALRLHIRPIRLLAPAILLLVLLGRFHQPHWPAFTLLASPLLLEFLAGVVIGEAIMRGVRLPQLWSVALAVSGLLLLLTVHPKLTAPMHRAVMWGIPAAMIVLGTVSLEERFGSLWPQWTLVLGDASYSLYLCHVIILHQVARAFELLHLIVYGVIRRQDEVLMAVTCLIVALPLSVLLFEWVEKPVTNMLRRRLLGEGIPQSEKHPAIDHTSQSGPPVKM
jgi:exopolysaccharide production protein ExoZ